MALTLDAENKLEAADLIALYTLHEKDWVDSARETKAFIRKNFPKNCTVRMDDVAKALYPIIEVDERLTTFLAENKLRQKYWIQHFVDLIIDRAWPHI